MLKYNNSSQSVQIPLTLKTKQDNDDEEDNHVTQRYDDSSESSDTDYIDSTSDAKC